MVLPHISDRNQSPPSSQDDGGDWFGGDDKPEDAFFVSVALSAEEPLGFLVTVKDETDRPVSNGVELDPQAAFLCLENS